MSPAEVAESLTTGAVMDKTGLTQRQIFLLEHQGFVTAAHAGNERGSGHTKLWAPAEVERLMALAARLEWGMTHEAAKREADPPLPPPPPARPRRQR